MLLLLLLPFSVCVLFVVASLTFLYAILIGIRLSAIGIRLDCDREVILRAQY